MTNYMAKSGSGQICFTNPAKSGSGQISQKQIRYSPILNTKVLHFSQLNSSRYSAYRSSGLLLMKIPSIREHQPSLQFLPVPVDVMGFLPSPYRSLLAFYNYNYFSSLTLSQCPHFAKTVSRINHIDLI